MEDLTEVLETERNYDMVKVSSYKNIFEDQITKLQSPDGTIILSPTMGKKLKKLLEKIYE